jgi:hypothetical protein
MKNLTPQRVAAVDVFRALTMFLMLFVNDIPGLKNIPHWLKHAEMNEDMLGFSDTIFPAFLFCMGMSVSFAIQNRYRKGDTTLQVIAHIFWRTVALIAMGLFSLNSGGIEGGISHQWFCILMVIGFFLVWAVYPKAEGSKKYLFIAMKVLGVALLAFLVLYKDLNGKPFHQGWWGILGLIGWTYVVCAGFYLFTRESLRKNVIAWLVVMLLAVISHSSLIPQEYGLRVILLPFIPSDWTLHAFGMSGVLTSLLMQKYADREYPRKFITILCVLGVVMLIAALCSHPHWIISELVVLLPGCILPAVRLVLLADGCERQNALVRYYQTCRNSYTDMLYPSLHMVCCAAIAGFALSRAIERRCSGLIKIAYILPHHCPIDRTVGEG